MFLGMNSNSFERLGGLPGPFSFLEKNMSVLVPQIMGIINLTPDSFSDGGQFCSSDAVVEQVEQMVAAGAAIIDLGGESTRPFASPVAADEEISRVVPVIKALRKKTDIPLSIDTTKAVVARQALDAGATIVNDISALRHDPQMVEVVKEYLGPVVIMHMQGTPSDMQCCPTYTNVVDEICAFFRERVEWMEAQGIARDRIILDPGIGFGKTLTHNLTILRHVKAFKTLGLPVLIGHSRKSFLEKLLGLPVEARDCPTAIISALVASQGVDILRVHDVAATAQALRLFECLDSGS